MKSTPQIKLNTHNWKLSFNNEQSKNKKIKITLVQEAKEILKRLKQENKLTKSK